MKNNEAKILSNKPTFKRNAKVVTKHKDYIDFEGFEYSIAHNVSFDITTQTSICTMTLPL